MSTSADGRRRKRQSYMSSKTPSTRLLFYWFPQRRRSKVFSPSHSHPMPPQVPEAELALQTPAVGRAKASSNQPVANPMSFDAQQPRCCASELLRLNDGRRRLHGENVDTRRKVERCQAKGMATKETRAQRAVPSRARPKHQQSVCVCSGSRCIQPPPRGSLVVVLQLQSAYRWNDHIVVSTIDVPVDNEAAALRSAEREKRSKARPTRAAAAKPRGAPSF